LNENAESQSFGTAFFKICDFKSRGIKLEATPSDSENTLFKAILTKYGTHFLCVLYQKYPQPNLKIAEVPDR
jgi:Ni,Fe-hydrogenase III small subunit